MTITQEPVTPAAPLGVELNGINVISEEERKGTPRQLFLPWFAANVSVLGLGYGAYVLEYHDGISFWQGVWASVIGVVVSFLLCGFIALAGKRGSAPTLVLSRAAFGVRGNKLPTAVSWLLNVGWETVLTYLAAAATATVFTRIGWSGGDTVKAVALVVVALLVVGGGVLGFDVIMRVQGVITVITGILTIGFIALTVSKIHWSVVSAHKGGSTAEVVGAVVLVMTGFGLGWVNSAADYSRYLPRRSSSAGVVGWTTFGSAIAPIILVVFGLLLAGSSSKLNDAINTDPVGALATVLPTWYLVPFVIVAVLGLVGGAVLDIYSSGLALLTLGLKVPRYAAASVDGVVVIIGSIYLTFISTSFFGKFEGFLITLGVPIAGWAGVMLADIALRRRPYADSELYTTRGRYGDVRVLPVLLMVAGTVIGFGTVTNTDWGGVLNWQGYLLGPLGLGGKTGTWASAGLGVIFALALSFFGWLIFGRFTVNAQEAYDRPSGIPVPSRR
jgi:nucleobase:cation symporter-1, NCS1 family